MGAWYQRAPDPCGLGALRVVRWIGTIRLPLVTIPAWAASIG